MFTSIPASLVSLALEAKRLLRLLVHRETPRVALVVEQQRETTTSADGNVRARRK